MSLRKIKHPVEYSFLQWMNSHPDSAHWADRNRFFQFVKTVARFSARKWKNREYVKSRILAIKPTFDPEFLERHLDLFSVLLDFQQVQPLTSQLSISGRDVKKGHYIEVRVKNGAIQEVEVPFRHHRTTA